MTQQLIDEIARKDKLIERLLKDRKEQHKELVWARIQIEGLEDKIKTLTKKND
jgi:hypothetical protein